MKFRFGAALILALTFVGVAATVTGDANDIVEIRLRGRYYAEPATVQVTVAVEPNASNRSLLIEAESERMYRSSEITLEGAGEKRLHVIEFKGLPAGEYMLSASVFSNDDMRAVTHQELSVSGSGQR